MVLTHQLKVRDSQNGFFVFIKDSLKLSTKNSLYIRPYGKVRSETMGKDIPCKYSSKRKAAVAVKYQIKLISAQRK